MWISNKFFYKINYYINVMVIQSNVLRMILGWDIPFVYPNCECTPLIVSLEWIVKIRQYSICLLANLFVQILLFPC
jgi:hypothetical protein